MTAIPRRLTGVSLAPRTSEDAESALAEVARAADIAELRLDLMAEYDLGRLLGHRPCPVIVTNRPEREGGHFRGSEADRVRPLLEAIDLGADYVDVEHDAVQLIPDRKQTRLIVSYHDFHAMPGNLPQVHRELREKGADIVKVVGTARRIEDNLVVLDVLAKSDVPTIAVAMGAAGLISRVLALRYDSCFLTYATVDRGEPVAPGQLPVAVMRDVFHANRITSATSIFGVLGPEAPSDDTLAWFNTSTRRAGIDGVWVPFVVPDERSPGDRAAARHSADVEGRTASVVRAFRKLRVTGYVVEGSAQAAVLPELDEIASTGPGGHVNVIRRVGERLVGMWAASRSETLALAAL